MLCGRRARDRPFCYWWYITVPEARLALAKDKRLEGGESREYLLDLAEAPEGEREVERWFFSKWLRQAKPRRAGAATASVQAEVAEAAAVAEQRTALTTADAEPSDAATRSTDAVPLRDLFAPASLKGNATPKFFSGDNPIVVTLGALAALGVFASLARENSALAVDVVLLTLGVAFGASRLTLK